MERKKKIPERQCLGCNERKPKSELLRVVRTPDGSVCLDFKGKQSGRGAYICHDVECLKKARRAKRIERNLECEIPSSVYDEMEKELSENE